MNFKSELLELLKKYPDVREVHIKPQISYDIKIEGEKMDEVGRIEPVITTEPISVKSEYISPQTAALTEAERTIASLKSRANIKVTSNE